MTEVLQMRELFNISQHSHQHRKALKRIRVLMSETNKDEFYEELIRNVKATLQSSMKSPYTKNVLDFITKFLMNVSQIGNKDDETIIEDKENCDELGMETLGEESFGAGCQTTLLDRILKDLILKYLYSVSNECRYNTCQLIQRIFSELEDIDEDAFENIKGALIDRFADKEKMVRKAAALACHRFQDMDDPQDLLIKACQFHLKNDPVADVRSACLQVLEPTKFTLNDFINSTRDVKDYIRKIAYTRIADKIKMKLFSIDDRLIILRNGLSERSAAVKKTVETRLLPAWLKQCDGDFITLLRALDIQSDIELSEKLLDAYFTQMSQKVTEEVSELQKFADNFSEQFLNELNMFNKVPITVEHCFLWRCLAEFCKKNNITTRVRVEKDTQPLNERTDIEIEAAGSGTSEFEEYDLFDLIVPDLMHFSSYVFKFIENLLSQEITEEDLLDYEFMYQELMKISLLYEIVDDIQRETFLKCFTRVLMNEDILDILPNYINPIMKLIAKRVCTNSSDLLSFTVDLINDIHQALMEQFEETLRQTQASQAKQPELEEDPRTLEMKYAKLTVKMNEIGDDLDEAKKEENFALAQQLKEQYDAIKLERQGLINRRVTITSTTAPSQLQNTVQLQPPELKDCPTSFNRCLEILCGCLEYGNFTEINAVLRTHIEKVVFAGITNDDPQVRKTGIKALSLACFVSSQLAKQYFALFLQVLNHDSEAVAAVALKGVFDFLGMHGLAIFSEEEESEKSDSNIQNDSNCTLKESNASATSSKTLKNDSVNEGDIMDEILDSDNETEKQNNSKVQEKGQGDQTNSTRTEADDSDEEEMDSEKEKDFMEKLTNLFVEQLQSSSDYIRFIAAQGVGKLMLFGHIYSPQLISRLSMMWYDSSCSTELQQFIGVYLQAYAIAPPRAGFSPQGALEESFIETIEMMYEDDFDNKSIENYILFFTTIINDEGHKRLAIHLANKVLNLLPGDELATKYLLRSLSMLTLSEMEAQELEDFKLVMKKIQSAYIKARIKVKLITNRIELVLSKIAKQSEKLTLNASQTSLIEDFGSSSSNQASNSSSQQSQVSEDVTMITPMSSPVKRR